MKHICMVGVGYVGLTNAACFADLGNQVVALDISEKRIEDLRKGILPIYEPGLKEVVERNIRADRLRFTSNYAEALKDAEFVFICVGTPEGVDGEADLQYVRSAAESIARTMDHPLIVVNKSTVPVGTGDWVADIVREHQPKPIPFAVVSCPEFLREGSAVRDFFQTDRTVLGSVDKDAANQVAQLYIPLRAPIMVTDLRTAEMIKYASNAFLATRISFINEIANICEALGADVKEVAQGMGYDKRIGHHFLEPGVGYGGSCFEGDETVFVVENGSIVARTFESLFAEAGEAFPGDSVEVVLPQNHQVLAFNLQTGCPEIADVKALTRRMYNGNMVTLTTSMGRTITLTSDHPVILSTSAGFDVVPANKVSAGDHLMALTLLPETPKTPEYLNLIDFLEGTELESDVYVSPMDQAFTEQYSQYAAFIPQSILKYPHEVKQNNRMSLSLYRHLKTAGVLDVQADILQLYTAKGAATKINALIPVDGDLMRLCGYYLAEGFISLDTGRAGAQRQRVGFTFHVNETEYVDDMRGIINRYGMKFIERISTNACTTIISSRIFAWLMRDVLKLGTHSENKTLPTLAFNSPAPMRFELLRGAFSGDGALTPVQGGKNMMLEYATVSKKLADGLVLLMQSLGIVPSIYHRMMNKSKQLAYILRVSGYEQLKMLTTIFGEKRRAQMESILGSYQRQIAQRGFGRKGIYATLNVTKTDSQVSAQHVYSLETTTETVVVSSGLVLHNCFPKDVKALSYMAQIHGTTPNLLQAVMGINVVQRKQIILKLEDMLGDLKDKVIAILGLAFKENTDDIRVSPSLDIAEMLHNQGALVRGYDPVAMENVMRAAPYIHLCEDAYELVRGSDALVVATPWNEFKSLDMARVKELMRQPVIVDGRNLYDPARIKELGFHYRGVGRGYNGSSKSK